MIDCIDARRSRRRGQGFCTEVTDRSAQPISSCYQCQRCGGGCPVAEAAGHTPNQFLWLVQFGLETEALESRLLWLCVGCGTCGARCPNRIATHEVIDRVRAMAVRRRTIDRRVKHLRTFHKLFLRQVRRYGRMHELSLAAGLKLRTLALFKDVCLAKRMFLRGKIPIRPHSFFGIHKVRSLFDKRPGGGPADE